MKEDDRADKEDTKGDFPGSTGQGLPGCSMWVDT